jgi:membrane protein implicated in regulation of membrane protease activity
MSLNPTLIWLLIGTVLCLIELLIPTAFVASVLGISAFLVALISQWLPLSLQVVVWMGLSLALVLVSRRFVPQRQSRMRLEATEAETLTEILPGKLGRVLYEGNSWAARSEDDRITIAPQQKVVVVERRGTTLIVMPENLLQED